MIILPDRNIPRAKLLLPVFDKQWKTPSQSQKKDSVGNENQTRFRIDAKSNDGVIIWRGWFDDRADFDAFLWAIVSGTIKQERSLWNLSTPNWQPWMDEVLSYEFATVTFLSSPTSSNQTGWTVPIDWNNGNNYVETIGGGASGRTASTGGGAGPGGGGGAYSKQTNIILTKGSTPTWQIGSGGPSPGTSSGANGISGGDTWFDGTTLASSSVGSKGGSGSSTKTGGSGGAQSSGIGSTKYSGGNGGTWSGGDGSAGSAPGGGGAAGPNGNGGNGGLVSGTYGGSGGGGNGGGTNGSSNNGNNGGAGGNNYLGSGSGAGAIYQGTPGQNGTNGGGGGGAGYGGASDTCGNGGDGTEWTTRGSGGGGGGRGSVSSNGGSGGSYGGGGGGGGLFTVQAGAPGAQGLIVITYEPLILGSFNMPTLL